MTGTQIPGIGLCARFFVFAGEKIAARLTFAVSLKTASSVAVATHFPEPWSEKIRSSL